MATRQFSATTMTTLSTKTNKLNINDVKRKFDVNILTKKTVKFYANEKNGILSPIAIEALKWCKENGFEMVSRPVGKSKINREFFNGNTQDVVWQWTSYTLK